jgi:cysteine protease ATG4
MTSVDRYKRLVQYFWDPEPTNDASDKSPIWCLGKEYRASEKQSTSAVTDSPPQEGTFLAVKQSQTVDTSTPPDSTVGSLESGSGYDDCDTGEVEGGWPTAFLEDFEAKLWFTYRSNFPAIAKSQDPKALSAMSLSVRLRSQLVDQGGFTSDTGWGCMIRSGQSLLANALLALRIGRGMSTKVGF